jgi:hypothetical protein
MAITMKRFYASEEEFTRFHLSLKLVRCPHCRRIGTLNLHGFLYGYAEHSPTDVEVRGRRIFCNSRLRRPGCGKTFSVLHAALIKGFTIAAATLWCFLKALAAGLPICEAFRASRSSLGASSAYRLAGCLRRAQSRLRLILSRVCPVPTSITSPLAQTVAHLVAAFGPHPIPAFQTGTQRTFL